jgi:hypothetical protein
VMQPFAMEPFAFSVARTVHPDADLDAGVD